MIKAKFTRIAPTANTEALPLGWFALSHRFIDDKIERRKMHGEWYKIKTKEATIYRVLRFSPRLKGSVRQGQGQLLIDWNGWLDLNGHNGKEDEAIDIEIKKASRWEYFHLALSHPDPTYRHNSVLALIGVGLGVVSLVISFI